MSDAWGGSWGLSWGETWGAGQEQAEPQGGGGKAAKRARQQRELAARNLEIIMAVVGIVTSGALDQ